MSDFHADTDADGITTITWDVADRSMNVMSEAGLGELEALIDAALADTAVTGIVLTSAKSSFAGGMDLNVIAEMRGRNPDAPAQALFDGLAQIHRFFRKIERAGMDPKTLKGGKPIVAALPGTALGIGLELPLACHRIIAADNPSAKIGLPEIQVGIFPGAGGTMRLSRKLGAMAAAPFLLEGKLVDPKAAKSAGLIDEVVAPEALLESAKAWVRTAKDADLVKPWDAKGFKFPGGGPYHPAGFMTFVGASAMVTAKTKGVYPAAKALLAAVYEGALVPFDTALRVEARHFVGVLLNPSSGAMIRTLFQNKEALEKGANRPAAPPQTVEKLGVLGAGMMGAGIALAAARAGIEVVLLDRDGEAAERGKAAASGPLDKAVSRRKMTEADRDAVLARITTGADQGLLAGCDLVVEAVFEDPGVKAEVTRAAEAALPAEAIFATNTSTLPIGELAQASRAADQFIGIHFFSPVDKMPLVEIIKGRDTGDRAVAKALDFVRQLKKTPIVVNDARYFYANRCILPYTNEGVRLVREGCPPALVENAARMLGMPVGPLQLTDEVSVDLGAKIARATRAAMGEAYADGDVDEVIFWLEGEGRLGRKTAAGFYDYDDKGKRTGLWPGLTQRYAPADPRPDLTEVQHRLLFAQVLEAVRAFEQGVLTDIREGDVAAILGWGFAPWSGGPFSWLDILGAPRAVEIAEALAAAHGPRFAAPALLREIAAAGDSFYGRFGSGAAAAA